MKFLKVIIVLIQISIIYTNCYAQKKKGSIKYKKSIKALKSNPLLFDLYWNRGTDDSKTKKEWNGLITKFYKSFELNCQNGFSFKSSEYSKLITELNLNVTISDISEKFAIRIYPALEGKRTLYLVFVGDTIIGDLQSNHYHSMLDNNYCILKSDNSGFYTISDDIRKRAAENDIRDFQGTFSNIIIDSSYRALVNRGWNMITQLFKNASESYAIKLIPGYDATKKSMFLFSKGEQINPDKSRTLLDSKTYYNHMDECPSSCPDNPIQ